MADDNLFSRSSRCYALASGVFWNGDRLLPRVVISVLLIVAAGIWGGTTGCQMGTDMKPFPGPGRLILFNSGWFNTERVGLYELRAGDTGHRVKDHIMTVIRNEVLDEKGTTSIQPGIQTRSGGIGSGTWL